MIEVSIFCTAAVLPVQNVQRTNGQTHTVLFCQHYFILQIIVPCQHSSNNCIESVIDYLIFQRPALRKMVRILLVKMSKSVGEVVGECHDLCKVMVPIVGRRHGVHSKEYHVHSLPLYFLLPSHSITVWTFSLFLVSQPHCQVQTLSKMINNMYREKILREVSSKQVGWYVALDCEMVGTGVNGSQSALARVSMVDWDGHVIFDTFVKVPVPVSDYRTYVSGVTSQDLLSDRAMDLGDVRYIVQNILNKRVLIGHGLDNDLSALMISHPPHDIRDTATYIPYMQVSATESSINGRKLSPRKLRDLVKDFLGWNIQEQGTAHSSVEDALASLALYKKGRPEWEAFISRKLREERRKENQAKNSTPSKRNQVAPGSGNRFGRYNAAVTHSNLVQQTSLTWQEQNHKDYLSSPPSVTMYPFNPCAQPYWNTMYTINNWDNSNNKRILTQPNLEPRAIAFNESEKAQR